MNALAQTSTPSDFRSRRVGLGCFGSILILGGLFFLLPALLSLVSHFLYSESPIEQPGIMGGRAAVYIFFSHIAFVVASISLGIGSILARRWARALTLVLSCYGLVVGIAGFAMMLLILPRMRDHIGTIPDIDPTVSGIVNIILYSLMFFMYIFAPAAFLLFYRSRHVKATCEHRNPNESWTDRCPLPVLAMAVGLFYFSLFGLTGLAFAQLFPFFGLLLRGSPAVFVMLALSLTTLYLAWGAYKQRLSAWTLAILLTVMTTVSSVITFSRINIVDEYSRLGFSDAGLEAMVATGLSTNPGRVKPFLS